MTRASGVVHSSRMDGPKSLSPILVDYLTMPLTAAERATAETLVERAGGSLPKEAELLQSARTARLVAAGERALNALRAASIVTDREAIQMKAGNRATWEQVLGRVAEASAQDSTWLTRLGIASQVVVGSAAYLFVVAAVGLLASKLSLGDPSAFWSGALPAAAILGLWAGVAATSSKPDTQAPHAGAVSRS